MTSRVAGSPEDRFQEHAVGMILHTVWRLHRLQCLEFRGSPSMFNIGAKTAQSVRTGDTHARTHIHTHKTFGHKDSRLSLQKRLFSELPNIYLSRDIKPVPELYGQRLCTHKHTYKNLKLNSVA
jgi:hypothetical protein